MLVDGNWVPTFPRARYLMGRVEYEHWSKPQGREDMVAVFGYSVQPVFDGYWGAHFVGGGRVRR